eukprot:3730836-Rhodomonas_salina.1
MLELHIAYSYPAHVGRCFTLLQYPTSRSAYIGREGDALCQYRASHRQRRLTREALTLAW